MRKFSGACVLIVTLLVQVALAAISVDSSAITTDGTTTEPHVTSITVASNSNKILLASTGLFTDSNVNSVTFNSDAMTNVAGASIQSTGSGFASSEIWYRLEPDVATADISEEAGFGHYAGVCGLSLYGVDQMSPIRDSDETYSAAATTLTLTLTTVAGDYVFYSLMAYAPSSDPGALDHTAGSATGETEIGEVDPFATQTAMSCAYAVASGSTTQIGYSWSASSRAALVAVSITPAAGGTSTPGSTLRRRRQ